MQFTFTVSSKFKRRVTILNCRCHCGSSIVFEFDPMDGEICIATMAELFVSKQYTVRKAIKDKLKAAWAMLIGKEYCLHEILLEDDKLDEFVKCVNEIDEIRKDYKCI